MAKKTLNVIDLFCGAGGLSYGFERAGFNILLGIDNDAKALETFEANHNGSKSICGDITNVSYIEHIKPIIGDHEVDVIIGGPPCQGFSLSGPRNFDDPRNKLYMSYIRLVDEIRPRAFVIENVPGLVSLFGGEVKDNIIKIFANMGYHVEYRILCAADYGVPQNRKRVVFVGTREGEKGFEYPTPLESVVTCEMALSDLPPLVSELGTEIQEYRVPSTILNAPVLLCENAPKQLSAQNFGLCFRMVKESTSQPNEQKYTLFFIDEENKVVSNVFELHAKIADTNSCAFALDTSVATKSKVFLVIRTDGLLEGEAQRIVPFALALR